MTKQELNALLQTLTVEEKFGQMTQILPHMLGENGAITGIYEDNGDNRSLIKTIGSILNMYDPDRMRMLQEEHMKYSKIPIVFMNDIIHGFKTIFPISPALASTFDTDIIKESARIAAREVTPYGVNVTYSPMVDITRDSRWGRICEGYGEDTYLSSVCAKAMVEGYQNGDLSADDTLAACVKHFALYGAPYDGRDYNAVEMSERMMRDVYMPPYKAAVDAGAAMIMTSFNMINGIHATINHHTNVDILRNEWGFDGVSITDCGSAKTCYEGGCTSSHAETAQLLVENDVNIDMMSGLYSTEYLGKALDDGLVTMEQIDRCVMRILQLKNDLGLFEDPYRYFKGKDTLSDEQMSEHLNAARKAVSAGSTLLKNDDKILPLGKNSNIAFVGPFIEDNDLTTHWSRIHGERIIGLTLREAIAEFDDLRGEYTYSVGCPFVNKDAGLADMPWDPCNGEYEKYADEAVKCASTADTVVFFMGESYKQFGESRSSTEAVIDEVQINLLKRIRQVNENIVVVLFNGRPLVLTEIAENSKAIIDVWFPGTQGHRGICDMLFGYTVPGGRLPLCFPRKAGQTPLFYSQQVTGHDSYEGQKDNYKLRYIDTLNTPLYPFGYGLSYTEFEYSNLRVSSDKMTADGSITVSVDIENIGERDAYETAQLYIRDRYAKLIARPIKELKNFKRVFIKSGEKATVSFEITEPMLRYYDKDCNHISEKGLFYAFIAPHSYYEEYVEFNLV